MSGIVIQYIITDIEGSTTSDGSTDTGIEVSVSVDVSHPLSPYFM